MLHINELCGLKFTVNNTLPLIMLYNYLTIIHTLKWSRLNSGVESPTAHLKSCVCVLCGSLGNCVKLTTSLDMNPAVGFILLYLLYPHTGSDWPSGTPGQMLFGHSMSVSIRFILALSVSLPAFSMCLSFSMLYAWSKQVSPLTDLTHAQPYCLHLCFDFRCCSESNCLLHPLFVF